MRIKSRCALLPGLLFAVALGCAIASCGRGDTGKAVNTAGWVPDHSIVIVHGLDSYFEDCGCAGADRGGVARIAGTAPSQSRSILFKGGTVYPQSLLERQQRGNEAQRELAWFAGVADAVFAALPGAIITLTEPEHEVARLLGKIGVQTPALDAASRAGPDQFRAEANNRAGTATVCMADQHHFQRGPHNARVLSRVTLAWRGEPMEPCHARTSP
jgi:hypothetical protein